MRAFPKNVDRRLQQAQSQACNSGKRLLSGWGTCPTHFFPGGWGHPALLGSPIGGLYKFFLVYPKIRGTWHVNVPLQMNAPVSTKVGQESFSLEKARLVLLFDNRRYFGPHFKNGGKTQKKTHQ